MGWSMNKYGNIFWQYVVSRRRLLYLVVIFLMVDLVFAFLFPETGTVFLYATLMLGFFTLFILIWDFAMTFQEYRKALLYGEIELASPLEHLLYEKYTEEQQVRLAPGAPAVLLYIFHKGDVPVVRQALFPHTARLCGTPERS